MSAEDLASLEATVELLSDPDAMDRVRQAQIDIENGDFVTGEENGPDHAKPRPRHASWLRSRTHSRARRGEYRVPYEIGDVTHAERILAVGRVG